MFGVGVGDKGKEELDDDYDDPNVDDTTAKATVLPEKDFVPPTQPRRSRNVLSKYERTRVLATRAEQIGRGTPALVDRLDGDGPAQIAEREFGAGLIPFIIRRYLPDGSAEDWRLDELGPCDRRLSHK